MTSIPRYHFLMCALLSGLQDGGDGGTAGGGSTGTLGRVLVVEDDEFSAMVVCSMLRLLGYSSTLVTLGSEAKWVTAWGMHAML